MSTKPAEHPARSLLRTAAWQLALIGGGYLAKQVIKRTGLERRLGNLANRAVHTVRSRFARLSGSPRPTRSAWLTHGLKDGAIADFDRLETHELRPWKPLPELGGES